jgi:DNA-binding NtrC family response regulator
MPMPVDGVRSSSLFSLAASPSLKLPALLDWILEEAESLACPTLGAGIFLDEPETGWSELRLRPGDGVPRASRERLLQDSRSPMATEGAGGAPLPWFRGAASTLTFPLFEREPLTGELRVESAEKRAFSSSQRSQLAELARLAGIAISRLRLRDHAAERGMDCLLAGGSPRLLEMERQVKLVASDSRRPVLLLGERGSGKELAAFSDTLLSDELFGHDKHSFTGAQTSREGVFQAAEGGTLFFDEIGDMPPTVQASLLRVLDRGEFHRIGRDRPVQVNVRIVAATNRDLPRMVAEGSFRADLFDRLNVFPIALPPLRDRREDIPLLISHFLRQSCQDSGRQRRSRSPEVCQGCRLAETVCCVEPEAFRRLSEHDYPGNVRELKNLAFRLAALVCEDRIGPEHAVPHLGPAPGSASDSGRPRDLLLETAVREHILAVLRSTDNNKTRAARLLGIPLTTLVNKMKKLGI